MTQNLVLSNQLASPSLSNLLVNGGFEIWQRGAGAFTANSAYTADRWQIFLSGTDTISVSKDTTHQDTPSVACAAITFTLGSGGGASELYQKLEDFTQLRGQTISVSMRVNQSVASACRLAIEDGVSTTAFGSTSAVTGSYVTLTATATIATNATTVQIDLRLLASATIYADNAMLIVGSTPVAYVPFTPADEIARCFRYYQRFVGIGSNTPATAVGQAYQATGAILLLPILAHFAVIPVLSVSAVSDWSVTNTGFGPVVCTNLSVYTASTQNVFVQAAVASGLTAGQTSVLLPVSASSWVALEANP